jgi:hypothetical protein
VANSLDDFSGDPLTELENKRIRKMMQDQAHMDWLWATARTWGGYVSAAAVAWFTAKDYIIKIIKAMFS